MICVLSCFCVLLFFFFFNDTATTEIYTLSLHDALPIYTLTKHALVGFVRSVAPQLAERGIRINAVCPGFADTPMVAGALRESLEAAGFPLLQPEEVADAVLRAARSEDTGEAWIVQPGRDPEPYGFRGIPGARTPDAGGVAPPL